MNAPHHNLDIFDHHQDPAVNDAAGLFTTMTDEQILERAMEILEERHKPGSEALKSPGDTRRYLRMRMANLQHEVFGALWLDNRHRVIEIEDLAAGTVDGAAVYPREVVKAALNANAAAVLFFHNHPSGCSEPSQADIALTRRLKEALGLVDIRVLDHLVVSGAEDAVSLAERGLM
ncbi:JAB domain-containing protein [uncultured Marinobacter sp.]|uniref:JAB domain-containing protein n=1 Tax=uncultured Marinobacter sp. TaxID=187379 RepID=UPI00258BB76C|nr:JAB domain-containing protein [uncultured Marinobacter sp.]